MISFALRYTSDSFFLRFEHYHPLWRGRWPGRLGLRNPKSLSEKILYLRVHIGSALDVDRAVEQLNAWLDTDYARQYRFRQFRQVPRRVMAEQFLGPEDEDIRDYKFWCFDGKCGFVVVDIDRYSDHRKLIVDTDWNPLPVESDVPNPDKRIPRPAQFDRMVSIAESLAARFIFARVDLYEDAGEIYFGEFGFTPHGGIPAFSPPEWNRKLGDLMDLPT
jgi:hypothetical protein